jgi:integrase
MHAGETGEHVDPSHMTLAAWVDHWIANGAPGKRKKRGSVRTVERYQQLLKCHVLPVLGDRRLQRVSAADLDKLHVDLEAKVAASQISPRTHHHVHVVLGACLETARRSKRIVANPMDAALKTPPSGDRKVGAVLDATQLKTLLDGFKRSTLFPIVAVAVCTGARRGEILALQWSDLNVDKQTISVTRAIDETKAHGRRLKEPKSWRGVRTIEIDNGLVTLLLNQHEKHLRIAAQIPDRSAVDLSLIKLPERALMFPSTAGESFDFCRLRDGHAVSREFARQARKRGFANLRFHDLRASHASALLSAGKPIHEVAARLGHDPSVLMKKYAKPTEGADADLANTIGALLKGALGD